MERMGGGKRRINYVNSEFRYDEAIKINDKIFKHK